MNRQLAFWYGHWNLVFHWGLWWEFIQFDACITIVPIGEHPGIHIIFCGGFFKLGFDFYYCDHDHHIPAPAEQGDGIQEDAHEGRDG